ncbi:MAG: carbohydrate ABC transporter substrate-binding protein [Anaerolineales bacterium]|nr:carbohydrate ABC transporter substrate-binding protein [Anaerolineales bacterium]MBX3037294.1 carbohydrate ABC transporter substrate-binding protein [Anaerolineales bacterium]
MRKSLLTILSLLMIASMVLAACGGGAPETDAPADSGSGSGGSSDSGGSASTGGEKQVLKVWSFTNEILTMAVAFEGQNPDVDVQFTMIPMDAGEYQTKIKAAIGTADVPDVVALEAAFVKEWVEADFLADLGDLLPLAEELQTYPSVVEVGTHEGVTKAYSYQATPGAFFYRRSIATECLGTDDPAEVQALVNDIESFLEVAETIKQCNPNYFTVGTSGELFNPFLANRAQPWIVDGALVIDPQVEAYIDFAKLMRDNGYESQANQWSEGWFAGMNDSLVGADGQPKKVFSYFLPTWGLPYVLIPNSGDTGGDWAMINGPLAYQWGGTWVGAMADSKNLDLAKQFVAFVALNEENLTNWATGVYTNEYLKAIDPTIADGQSQAAGDFVSSQVVVEKITSSFDGSPLYEWLGGQNNYEAFSLAAPNVNGALLTGSDDAIQRALQSARDQYLNGEIDKATMWKQWLDVVRSEFPDLVIPEPPQ